LIRKLIEHQVRLSYRFDALLPQSVQIDGNLDFLADLVPRHLTPGSVVCDVGGGKNPTVDRDTKRARQLTTIGIDIDQRELDSAPAGTYDQAICADISQYRGRGDADLVICQALLEHVPNTEGAVAAIATLLKPGGRALLFVPSRNAVFARLNLLVPQEWKRRILHGVFPHMRRDHGFPAFYHGCTPAQMETMARQCGLEVEERRRYFQSDYFRFCLPLHAIWRLWVLLFRLVAGKQVAAETFSLVLRKAA
jgi:2-polyprenyl-6-hydroxyphenyl methylase/3-demethylubiquinone-9 3-methyltransferase